MGEATKPLEPTPAEQAAALTAGATCSFTPASQEKLETGAGGCLHAVGTREGQPVVSAVICVGRKPRRRCEFCHQGWSVALCDYLTGGDCPKCKGTGRRSRGECQACAGQGRAMCNRRACRSCVAHVEGQDEDYCPEHRVTAGFPPLIRKEPFRWLDEARYGGRCLHRGCEVVVAEGERALYFPQRRRVMCAECGKAYERLVREGQGAKGYET